MKKQTISQEGVSEVSSAIERADSASDAQNEQDARGSGGWTRRKVLLAAATSLGTAATAKSAVFGTFISQGGSKGVKKPDEEWYPLRVPETIPATASLTCTLTLVNLGDSVMRQALTYNGQLPGPTWVVRRGETVSVRLYNSLSENTITHWHGLHVDYANDGGPRIAIGPEQSYYYNFPIIQRAGLNFYHPHPDMLTGKQVCLGMAGAFIVRDDEEDALNLPAAPYELPLVIRDVSFDSKGNLVYNPTSSGFRGKFPLVNGTLKPTMNVDKGMYRLRVLNGANAQVFRLALNNGAPFTIIGNDGGLLRSPAVVSQIELGMGERLDLLVDFSSIGAGQSVMLRCLDARWDLVKFIGTGAAGYAYSVPSTLSAIESLAGPAQPTRTFSFDGMSRINGKEYDSNRIDFQVPFGVVERWQFKTAGNAPHPVHIHGASFQVVSRTGGRGKLFSWESGWKDTVLLNDKEVIDVLIRFDAYRGLYVIHCHQLEHESAGMMSNFEVV